MVQLAGIIGKRRCIHKELVERKSENDQLNFELNRLQALANIGVTTSMIAHEINNLLTPLVNYATLALNNPDDRQLAKKALQKTAQNSDRASKIMQSILNAMGQRIYSAGMCRFGEQMRDYLGIAGRFEYTAVCFIFIPKKGSVYQIAVVCHRYLTSRILAQ